MLYTLVVTLNRIFQEIVDPNGHLGVVENLVHEGAALGVEWLHVAVGCSLEHVALKLIVLILVHGLLLIIDIIIYVFLGLHLQIIKIIATQLIDAIGCVPQDPFELLYILPLGHGTLLDSVSLVTFQSGCLGLSCPVGLDLIM